MKYTSLLIVCLFLISCNSKPTKESVEKFDMSVFCSDYHVLVNGSGMDILYTFIGRKEYKQRFFVWKNKNKKEFGYGYLYSYTLSADDAIKNGVFNTASDAVRAAEENLPDNMIVYLSQIIPIDNRWSIYGEMLYEICIHEPTKKQAPDFSRKLDKDIIGLWKGNIDCEMASGSFDIGKKNPIHIEVNSNQIYIAANVAKQDGGVYKVYLKEPEDLGSGGTLRPWSDYSVNKPIAELSYDGNKLAFRWFGFYNKATHSYEWVNEPDWFSTGNFDGNLYLCR